VNQSNRRHVGTVLAIQMLSESSFGDRLTGFDALSLQRRALSLARTVRLTNNYIIHGGDLNIKDGTAHNFPGIDRIMSKPLPGIVYDKAMLFDSFVAGGLQDAISGALELVEYIAPEVNRSYLEPDGEPQAVKDQYLVVRLNNVGAVPKFADKRWGLDPQHWGEIDTLSGEIHRAVNHGSDLVEEELQSAFRDLFSSVRLELRGLFGMNVGFVLLVFFGIFRQTVLTLYAEVGRTRRFPSYMPLHTLSPHTVANIRNAFADEDE